jgi:RNA polymerase sigma factor (sigma-70 family)
MTIDETMMPAVIQVDAELVGETLSGNRNAFSQIVSRYESLICSLAYSATGSLGLSEDLAQETFITAWKHLGRLRERDKLRAWLCGIARNRINNFLRREGHEPVRDAEPLDAVSEARSPEPSPVDNTISKEEAEMLWRAIAHIPPIYREPLVLFYREQQSVETVAAGLGLSEDAVKQRLSRGRKLLQEQVLAFVEGALARTAPGQAFSSAVLAALPMAAGTAATAGLGAGTKGAVATKSGVLAACLAPLAPFLGIAAGVGAHWLIIRDSTPDRARRAKSMACVVGFWMVYLGLAIMGENFIQALGRRFDWDAPRRFVAEVSFWWLFLAATIAILMVTFQRMRVRHNGRMAAGEIVSSRVPMKPGTVAAVVAGGFLLFSWFLRFEWHDRTSVAVTIAAMVLMALRAFSQCRGKTAPEVARILGQHLNGVALLILLVINLRTDVWVASAYGVKVSDAPLLLPTRIVPLLTLALILWFGLLTYLTKPKAKH